MFKSQQPIWLSLFPAVKLRWSEKEGIGVRPEHVMACVAALVSLGSMWGWAADGGAAFAGQVIAGTAGGALFGAAGHWLGIEICGARAGGDVTARCWPAGVYGYAVGVPLGAALGVCLAGASYGIAGDQFLAAAGAVVGEALGLGVLAMIEGTFGQEELSFIAAYGLVPFLSAALSTTGYRMGTPARGKGPEAALLSFALRRVRSLGPPTRPRG